VAQKTESAAMDRWIEETFHPHWRTRLKADKILFEERTEHQYMVIFDNATWGRVLMLDGVVQLTTTDEFIYHEMMAHVPLFAVAEPKRVLVVGGGDGGVLREVLKHKSVEKATLCEIDRSVIDLSLEHFPQIANGCFDDKRSDIVIADGLKYVAKSKELFDAIIVDSSEPIGPSAVLHSKKFFADCHKILRKGGVFVTQNGLPFMHPEHLAQSTRYLAGIFKDPAVFLCGQPCYFGGPFALHWASDDKKLRKLELAEVVRRFKKSRIKTRYWTPEVQLGAFALPRYIQDVVAGV
jgi:spermidine synthase